MFRNSTCWWRGIEILKHPNDLWAMQEAIHEAEADVVVETGTFKAGATHFYADFGVEVHSVDTAPPTITPPHPNITYYRGKSTHPRTVYLINQACRNKRVLVDLDSDHSKENVLAELETYAHLVSVGSYLIVEDTALGGPAEALKEWLPDHPEFEPDPSKERFGETQHPGGWLKRCS